MSGEIVKVRGRSYIKVQPVGILRNSKIMSDIINRGDTLVVETNTGNLSYLSRRDFEPITPSIVTLETNGGMTISTLSGCWLSDRIFLKNLFIDGLSATGFQLSFRDPVTRSFRGKHRFWKGADSNWSAVYYALEGYYKEYGNIPN